MISLVQARKEFTQVMIDTYKEMVKPTNFLRSFFVNKETAAKEVSIEVRRATEYFAEDVRRGTEPNRNTISVFSNKIWVPPYYNEEIDHNSIRNYDVLFGDSSGSISATTMGEIAADVAEDLAELRFKIERSYERQCAQVLQTGIVTLKSGTNIDFQRKAGSIVDLGAGFYWDSSPAIDPTISIKNGCTWLRENGLVQDAEFIMILGDDALQALLNNSVFQAKADLKDVKLMDISMPQHFSDVGATLHGVASAGSYKVQIWTYPQSVVDPSNDTRSSYIDTDTMILLPKNARFKMAFGGVPMIMRDVANSEYRNFIKQTKGAYVLGNRIDERAKAHFFDISSAGIAVPVAVDTIYTAQVHS